MGLLSWFITQRLPSRGTWFYIQQDKMLHMDGPRTLWCCSGSEDIWKKSCIHKGMLMYDMKAARVLWAEAFHRWKLVPPEGDTIYTIARPTSIHGHLLFASSSSGLPQLYGTNICHSKRSLPMTESDRRRKRDWGKGKYWLIFPDVTWPIPRGQDRLPHVEMI